MDGGTLDRAGSRLRYWLDGPTGAPLVVFSHGAAMDHRMFDPQVPALTAAGYRTLTWDIRGHGESKPIGDLPLSTRDLTADLLAILDELGEHGPLCVGGQSLGGYLAQELVFRHPERVAAVVIIGSTCVTMPISRRERWALAASPLAFRLWPAGALRRTIATHTAVTPAAREYALDAASRLSKAEFVTVWRAVAGALHPEPGYRIEQPLLLCHGDQDRAGNVARVAPRWAARDPRCRYEVVPRAGHNANQDNPGWFNETLLDFLRTHYPVDGR
ncbi:pimeloyl-ACP methyl ester carboxylesterase [Prauserella shujinwangii]|uniref:Pimeloyl-ACP methyl ester carboxylesterase n=1 Tax=Prauserella shujinwangii TaxID=1453103 RepID=A0A2T0LYD5_9PSEU|nr:alpha/beta hydrolase [Prauserella shujinwangii]PRX49117.1 pimeloyl-ACP methyl ester carboxylesterase [Prauserella shujinwangii]